jgi:hypothetical protein
MSTFPNRSQAISAACVQRGDESYRHLFGLFYDLILTIRFWGDSEMELPPALFPAARAYVERGPERSDRWPQQSNI